MKIKSREITYRIIVEQIFFEDGTELVVRTGWPEGQELDLEVELDWVEGKPDWAEEYKHNEKAKEELRQSWIAEALSERREMMEMEQVRD